MSLIEFNASAREPLPFDHIVEVTRYFKKFWKAQEQLSALFHHVQLRDYRDPVLHGGALRDLFMGASPEGIRNIKDFDFLTTTTISAPDKIDKRRIFCLKRRLLVDFNGNYKYTTAEEALRLTGCDAPINGVAMDANGRVFAHHRFIEHANQGLWQILPSLSDRDKRRSEQRFDRVSERLEKLGIKLHCRGHEKLHEYVIAPRSQVTAAPTPA